MTWFIVLMIHCASAPTCPNAPAPVTLAMPSQEVCVQVRDLNAAEHGIECWAKPK